MKRTGITKTETADSLVVEFDEAYKAGEKATFRSHYREEFVADEDGMTHKTTIRIDADGRVYGAGCVEGHRRVPRRHAHRSRRVEYLFHVRRADPTAGAVSLGRPVATDPRGQLETTAVPP